MPEQWRKRLSRTDAGESKTHQSGILIPVRHGERMFPNGTGWYLCEDDRGIQWQIRFIDRAKKGESRITYIRDWMRRFAVKSGDAVLLIAMPNGSYRLSHIPEGATPKEEVENLSGFPEGATKQVLVNRHERDPRNRQAAITFHGTACLACNIRMAERYGEIADGFIHIHHTESLAATGEHTPDLEDLIPLCPNCHAVVHLADPPLTLEQLKQRMESGHE